jgi:hypothetical protein
MESETCSKCKAVFLPHHHFIRCEANDCPMKDGNGPLLDWWKQEKVEPT